MPITLPADHPYVWFNFCRRVKGICEAEMH